MLLTTIGQFAWGIARSIQARSSTGKERRKTPSSTPPTKRRQVSSWVSCGRSFRFVFVFVESFAPPSFPRVRRTALLLLLLLLLLVVVV